MRFTGPVALTNHARILLAALVLSAGGCVETYKPAKSLRPKTERLVVQHTAGGTHYRLMLNDGIWYQLLGPELLVVNPINGRVIDRQDLSGSTSHGPASDMLLHEGELWVVLDDVSVVRLSLDDPRRPWLEDTVPVGALGIRPLGLGLLNDRVVVRGDGGVVDPISGLVLARTDGIVTSVADTPDGGVYCQDRRIYRINDGAYVGSASQLHPVDIESNGSSGSIIFVRHEQSGSLVGFADEDLLEQDGGRMTVVVPGRVSQVYATDDGLLVVSDAGLRRYAIRDESLVLDAEWPIAGVLDAGRLDNRIIVSGTFGRGILDSSGDLSGREQEFLELVREPAGLTAAVSDGRSVLGTSPQGDWMYQIGHECDQVETTQREFPEPSMTAVTLGWDASIIDDGRAIEMTTPLGTDLLAAPDGSRFTCVVAADGVLWLGHQDGIIMVRLPAEQQQRPLDWETMTPQERAETGLGALDGMTKLSVRLDGPIIFMEPLMLGGGVAYASRDGGFGVVAEELQ
jgi:hypothetical protein